MFARDILKASDFELFKSSGLWTMMWMGPLFYWFGLDVLLVTLFLMISVNDVIHKYSHMSDSEAPRCVKKLQDWLIIQGHDEHHQHHIHPHEINYCSNTPYLNSILERIRFWRRLESIIERLTGAKPRAIEYEYVDDDTYPSGIKFLPQ